MQLKLNVRLSKVEFDGLYAKLHFQKSGGLIPSLDDTEIVVSVSGSDVDAWINLRKEPMPEGTVMIAIDEKAVHPGLLAALEDCNEQLGRYLQSVEDGKDDDAESAYQFACAAIAAAKGATP